jgi:hypothetical protein
MSTIEDLYIRLLTRLKLSKLKVSKQVTNNIHLGAMVAKIAVAYASPEAKRHVSVSIYLILDHLYPMKTHEIF